MFWRSRVKPKDISEVRAVARGENMADIRYLVRLTRDIEPLEIQPGRKLTRAEKSVLKALSKREKANDKLSQPAAEMLDAAIEALNKGAKPPHENLKIQFGRRRTTYVPPDPEEERARLLMEQDAEFVWNKKLVLSRALGLPTTLDEVDKAEYPRLLGFARGQASRIGAENMRRLLRNSANRLASERGLDVTLTQQDLGRERQRPGETMWLFRQRVAKDLSRRRGRIEFGEAADEIASDLNLG